MAKIVIAVENTVHPMRIVGTTITLATAVVVITNRHLAIVSLAQVPLHRQNNTTTEIVVQLTITVEISRNEPLQAVEQDITTAEEVTVATITIPPITANITTKEQVNIARMEIIHQAAEDTPIKDLKLGGLINSIELNEFLV